MDDKKMISQKLWYKEPADSWEKALPIGNGNLGAMLFGGIDSELIQLNEDTLWSGFPKDLKNYEALNHLEDVRSKLFDGRYRDAQAVIEQNMLGTWNQAFLPMADLLMKYNEIAEVTDYKRELDLNKAVHTTKFESGNVYYLREAFISFIDRVLVYRISASEMKKVNVTISMSSPLHHEINVVDEANLKLDGECPSNVMPHYLDSDNPMTYSDEDSEKGMKFGVMLKIIKMGGTSKVVDKSIQISAADSVMILLSASTSFNGHDKNPRWDGKDYFGLCSKYIENAALRNYKSLWEDHIKDYSALFNRVDISLSKDNKDYLPTDERLMAFREGESDPQLAALLFQYGRYLLISSSRPGTQPSTLQGIWNKEVRPYWSCNWTTNINAQMNYWHAETCNLAECHEPLFDLIEGLSENGSEVARIHYGCRGWVTHHNVDIWRTGIPAGGWNNFFWAGCSFWPMGGVWLCRHLWEHYSFSKDIAFLENKAYPIMKEAAQFCLDWLIEDKEGRLVTSPSTSPENAYLNKDGEKCNVGIASTMDNAIIREIFIHCIEGSKILNNDDSFRHELENALEKLRPYKIGKHGQLQEWSEDYEEFEPDHRHVSHLYGLYPGNTIIPLQNPDVAAACRTSIERRVASGGGGTGWSLAWILNLYARLGDGEASNQFVKELLKNSVYPNLFDLHPPLGPKEQIVFQIDGNFGASSGIAEMLMQSHTDEIYVLPALPKEWEKGYVKGLRARGGFTIDIEWENGKLNRIKLVSNAGGICRIRKPDGELINIETIKGSTYYL